MKKNPTFKYFSKNGEILPIEEGTISLFNLEYSYGFGVYENIRVIHTIPYFLDLHIERLLTSAKIISLQHGFSHEILSEYIQNLIKALGTEETYNIKVLLIGGKTDKDVLLLLIPLRPHFTDRTLYRDGVSVITTAYERSFPNAKTLNMLQSYMAYRKAREHNCYEALLLNKNGYITEGTRTNFFLIKKNSIVSAPKETILEGVTKKIVLALAGKNGYDIREAFVATTDLPEYDGAFFTSTGAKIMPIRAIDSYVFPAIPEQVRNLMKLYDDYLKQCGGTCKDV